MQVKKLIFLYEGRTNSVFRDPFAAVPGRWQRLGVECLALDLRHTPLAELGRIAQRFGADVVLQVARNPQTAWRVARQKSLLTVPWVLWNLEEPNGVAQHDALGLAEAADLYLTLDPRMLRHHRRTVVYLPLFFDEEIYYPRHLPRDLSTAFLIQYSTPRLREILRPLIAVLEEDPQSFVSTNRPMKGWGGSAYRALAGCLDRLPLALAVRLGLIAQRTSLWRQDESIRAQGYFVNRDEEEKAFIYGRARIGIGFSRVFGAWEQALTALLPDYEKDAAGHCVQIKSRHFEIAGAGAMLLSDDSPELAALFEPGTEYVAYDYTAPDDLRDKLRFYLHHEDARQRIADAGYARARRDHTLTCRLVTLLDECRRRW